MDLDQGRGWPFLLHYAPQRQTGLKDPFLDKRKSSSKLDSREELLVIMTNISRMWSKVSHGPRRWRSECGRGLGNLLYYSMQKDRFIRSKVSQDIRSLIESSSILRAWAWKRYSNIDDCRWWANDAKQKTHCGPGAILQGSSISHRVGRERSHLKHIISIEAD